MREDTAKQIERLAQNKPELTSIIFAGPEPDIIYSNMRPVLEFATDRADDVYYPQALTNTEIEAILQALKKNTHLKSITFCGSGLGKLTFGAAIDVIPTPPYQELLFKLVKIINSQNSSLTELDLYRNNLGHHGMVHILELLTHNQQLKSLKLDANDIGDTGVKYLAAALSDNSSLKRLSLAHNNISAVGCEQIANSLLKNTVLTYLNLSCNHLDGPQDLLFLAIALQYNTSLEELHLKCFAPTEQMLNGTSENLIAQTPAQRVILKNIKTQIFLNKSGHRVNARSTGVQQKPLSIAQNKALILFNWREKLKRRLIDKRPLKRQASHWEPTPETIAYDVRTIPTTEVLEQYRRITAKL